MLYDKPHLPYDQQLDLMTSRGLECPDRTRALEVLASVGYYRLSAYVYPFREMLPDAERGKVSPVHHRREKIRPGVSMAHVEALWRFDKLLRLRITDGLETLEVGLRTKIAHTLGARDPFGHLNDASLDRDACQRQIRPGDREPEGAYTSWLRRYRKLLDDAKYEDYVRHHLVKYQGSPLPIWIAVEFMDFGALSRLFGFLDRRDQNQIALSYGLSPGAGRRLDGWLKTLGYLRNMAAHHNRLWNRSLTVPFEAFNPGQVGESLKHVAALAPLDRVYRPLAVAAHLVRHTDRRSRWPVNLAETVGRFPEVPYLSPEEHMGFPEGWKEMSLWRP